MAGSRCVSLCPLWFKPTTAGTEITAEKEHRKFALCFAVPAVVSTNHGGKGAPRVRAVFRCARCGSIIVKASLQPE